MVTTTFPISDPLPPLPTRAVSPITPEGTLRDYETALILQRLQAAGGMIGGRQGAAAWL